MKVEKPDISMKSHRVDSKLIINVTGRDSKNTEAIFNQQLKRLEELFAESEGVQRILCK